jgi:hypothetical protein
MKISFDTRREDLMAFYSHYWDSDPATVARRRRGRFTLPTLCIIVGFLRFNMNGPGHWMWLVWFGGIALLWILVHPWLRRSAVKAHFKQFDDPDNQNLFGKRTMELGNEKVIVVSDKIQETMLWSAFVRAFETQDHFFLYIARQQAIVIPKRDLSATENEKAGALFASHIPVFSKSENKKTKK